MLTLYLSQGEDPLGAIHLRGCVVTAVEDMPDCKEPQWKSCYRVFGAFFQSAKKSQVIFLFFFLY